jgi:hypothetical protein
MQDAFYSLWRQGATTITWFLLRDQPPTPSFAETYQSGLYRSDGTAKALSVRAFRLPFVARRSGARVRVWGHTAAPGQAVIERRTRSGWKRVRAFGISGGVFTGVVRAPRGSQLRARAGADVSLARTAR